MDMSNQASSVNRVHFHGGFGGVGGDITRLQVGPEKVNIINV